MPEPIDLETVRHIARLSRIALSDEELRTFGGQLADILAYFGKLQELDTAGVAPMAHAVELHNVLAADEPGESLPAEQVLANAPAREGDLFRVPRVIGESS